MVGGEEHVGVVGPAALGDALQDAPARLVDQLVHHVALGADLAHLVVGERAGTEPAGAPLAVLPAPLVPGQPVRRLLREHGPDGLVGAGVARRQVELAPRHASQLARRRVPRMVGVGEAHPAEPVVVRVERVEPRDGVIGDPVGVVPVAGDRVVLGLGRTGVAATGGAEQRGEARQVLGVVLAQPAPVVRDRAHDVVAVGVGDHHRRGVHHLHRVVEPAPRPGVAAHRARVLLEAVGRVEAGFEVRLADEGGAVAGPLREMRGDAGRVGRQRHAVGEHAVRAHVLASQHRRASRHADGVLVVGPPVDDALGRQRVDHRRAGDRAAVAAQGVVALLVGGDEQDLAPHRRQAWLTAAAGPVTGTRSSFVR